MPILQLWGARALQRLKRILTQIGAFDLPSIITGVVVVGILAAGVLAAVFGVIPFAQDKAAQQDLDSVRTSEGVAKARLDGYKNKAGLLDAGIISDAATLAVSTDAAGSCFVGISKSSTGTIFFNSDKTTRSEILTATTDTGCIDAATRDALIVEVGGFGSVSGGSEAGDGTGGGTVPGGGMESVVWRPSKLVDTNRITDPSFEVSSAGWTIPTELNENGGTTIARSVTHAEGSGVDGGDAVHLIADRNVSTNQTNYAYFRMPDASWGMTVKVNSSAEVHATIVNYSSTGDFLGEGFAATKSGSGWQTLMPSNPTGSADVIFPAGYVQYLKIRIGANWVGSVADYGSVLIDQVSSSETQTYFDGNTPATAEHSYRWTVEANASTSEMRLQKKVSIPSEITLGQDFTLHGAGFPANMVVTAMDDATSYSRTVTTDASGNFTLVMNIPADGGAPVGPNNYISISADSSTDYYKLAYK